MSTAAARSSVYPMAVMSGSIFVACSQCHHDEQRVPLARRLPTRLRHAPASHCGLTGGD
jgi:hypothetical protein